MKQYLDLLNDILENGVEKKDRTGVGTIGVFGRQLRFDLADSFPIVTTRKIHLKSIIYELLWFIRGETNIKWLNDHGVTIWDEWADKNGELGPVYGKQWRKWETSQPKPTGHGSWYPEGESKNKEIDQLANLIHELKTNPNSRRLIITAWNPAEIGKMNLPPCHCLMQFNTREVGFDRVLDCILFQRSCDTVLGVPFNIASYALFTMMIAQVVGMKPGEFIWTGGDVHIYKNHIDSVKTQLSREPLVLPVMGINNEVKNIDSFKYEDFDLVGYKCHPSIKYDIAV